MFSPRWLFILLQALGAIASALGGILGFLRNLGTALSPTLLLPVLIATISSIIATIRSFLGPAYTKVETALLRNGMEPLFASFVPLAQLVGAFNAVRQAINEMYSYSIQSFMWEVKAGYPIERLTAEELVILKQRNVMSATDFRLRMLQYGFDNTVADYKMYLATSDTAVNAIIEEYWKKSTPRPDVEFRLSKLGLNPEAIQTLLDNSMRILTIDQLLEARLKGYIPDTAMFYNMGKQLGYEQPELDLLEASNGEPISIGQALDLWNKKEGADLAISLGLANDIEQDWASGKGEADVNRAVLEGPLNNYWFPAIKKLRYQMLGATDYIRFAVRDVYNTAVRAANRLDEGYPEILAAKLRMLGYSPQDAKDAWAAHWELPSPTQVFEMLHRGKLPPGISVEDYLVSADYAPAWRQALTDISYNPITRTDAKRMYKLRGDFDELVRHFKDNGYSDQDANDLAEFTKQDVNLEGNNERRNLSSGLKNAVLAMYKGRTISADETRDVLRQLTYTDETIEQFILEADFFRIQDEKADVAGALKAAYVKALRSRDDTVALLQQAGWNGQPLDDLMGTWDLLRAATEIQPHQTASRDLTKGELIAAYKDEIITIEQLTDGIGQLGYDENETNVIVQLALGAKNKAERNDMIEVIHQSYLAGALDVSTTAVELDKISVPFLQKNNLIGKWKQELAKRIPDFTLAQLEGMIKAKVMDEATAQKYLQDQGYTSEQQTVLLSWWLGKRNPPPDGTSLTKTPLALGRNDYEALYITTKDNRTRAFNGLKSIGYTSDDANLILDAIDRNMQR